MKTKNHVLFATNVFCLRCRRSEECRNRAVPEIRVDRAQTVKYPRTMLGTSTRQDRYANNRVRVYSRILTIKQNCSLSHLLSNDRQVCEAFCTLPLFGLSRFNALPVSVEPACFVGLIDSAF